jgi:hypothetical protein
MLLAFEEEYPEGAAADQRRGLAKGNPDPSDFSAVAQWCSLASFGIATWRPVDANMKRNPAHAALAFNILHGIAGRVRSSNWRNFNLPEYEEQAAKSITEMVGEFVEECSSGKAEEVEAG